MKVLTFFKSKTNSLVWIQWAVIALILVLFFQFKSCSDRKLAIAQSTVDSLTLASQKSDSTVNTLGQKVYTQSVIITSNQKSIRQLSDSMFNLKKKDAKILKKVISYYSQRTHIVMDTVSIPYTDTTVHGSFKDSSDLARYLRDSTISVPRTVNMSNQYFSINETLKKEGIVINSIDFPDSQYIRVVENRGGFFRRVNGKLKFHVKKQVQIQTLHTNPLIRITGQNSVEYVPKAKPKILERALLIGAGVAIGLLL